MSNEIRWSLDLRWQRPDKSVGFYDLNEGVLMRTKEQPDLKINWDTFTKIERHIAFVDKLKKESQVIIIFSAVPPPPPSPPPTDIL